MKNIVSIIALTLCIPFTTFSQVSNIGLASQEYSKDITEYVSKEYLITKILKIPEGMLIGVEIDAITASNSGELSTIVYNCEQLEKRGILLIFWTGDLSYIDGNRGYGFLHLEYDTAIDLFTKLSTANKHKKSILNQGKDWNVVFRWADLHFVFWVDNTMNKIRVFWNGYDSEWSSSNLKTTAKRFFKSFE